MYSPFAAPNRSAFTRVVLFKYRGSQPPFSMADPARRATLAIAGATLGVYILIMAGATTAITEAANACSTWPTCNGRWLVPLDDPELLIAWGHRLIAFLVAGLVLGAAVYGSRATEQRRVRAALVLGLALYPFQAALGAYTSVYGPTALVSGIHLAVAMTIFGTLVLALAWTLNEFNEITKPQSVSRSSKPVPDTDERRGFDGPLGTLRAYLTLTKPRLMWLLCLVAAAGMALAAGRTLTFSTALATLGGGVLAIGASGTFNHVLERDVDRRMRRTADRPLATDTVGVRRAIVFGTVLAIAAVATFLTINLLAAVLGLAAIAYYSVIYTIVLKPNTVQNTVIGGLAGSFPAVIGAAAATNTIGLPALLLAAVIFLWTPAHFYNPALAYSDDYERGGFPMLPVVRGEATTYRHILLYLAATLIATALLSAAGGLGPLFALVSVVFGAVFLWMVVRLHRDRTRGAALRSFHASNAYLGAVLLAILVDTLAV